MPAHVRSHKHPTRSASREELSLKHVQECLGYPQPPLVLQWSTAPPAASHARVVTLMTQAARILGIPGRLVPRVRSFCLR